MTSFLGGHRVLEISSFLLAWHQFTFGMDRGSEPQI